MSKVFIVRHANTALNSKGVERGWQNPPLDDKGKKEAQATADKLSKNDTKIDIIYCSDLERAVQTAQIIGKTLGVNQLLKDWNLRTWKSGMDGEPQKKADVAMADMIQHPSRKPEDGESFSQFDSRVWSAVERILRANASRNILIVTHHKCERLIAYHITGNKAELNKEGCPPAGEVEYNSESGKLSKV